MFRESISKIRGKKANIELKPAQNTKNETLINGKPKKSALKFIPQGYGVLKGKKYDTLANPCKTVTFKTIRPLPSNPPTNISPTPPLPKNPDISIKACKNKLKQSIQKIIKSTSRKSQSVQKYAHTVQEQGRRRSSSTQPKRVKHLQKYYRWVTKE